MSEGDNIQNKLKVINFDLEDIDNEVNFHLHWGHIGGIGFLQNPKS
jgi:metal-dependent hydrolase (beta-lactamase superfamily II)